MASTAHSPSMTADTQNFKSQDPRTQAHLARVRDNQRRSRARRKAYLSELEDKFRKCEQLGVQASAEMQAAARKVLNENMKLKRALLNQGLSEAELDAITGEDRTEGHAQLPRQQQQQPPQSDHDQESLATAATKNLEEMLANTRQSCVSADSTACGASPLQVGPVGTARTSGARGSFSLPGNSGDMQAEMRSNRSPSGGQVVPMSVNTQLDYSTCETHSSDANQWSSSFFADAESRQQYQSLELEQSGSGTQILSGPGERQGQASSQGMASLKRIAPGPNPPRYPSQPIFHMHSPQTIESIASSSASTAVAPLPSSGETNQSDNTVSKEQASFSLLHHDDLSDIEDLLSLEMQKQLVRGLQPFSRAE